MLKQVNILFTTQTNLNSSNKISLLNQIGVLSFFAAGTKFSVQMMAKKIKTKSRTNFYITPALLY